jgi:hypothetical protein
MSKNSVFTWLAFLSILLISGASAQGYSGGYDPSVANNVISSAYELIHKIDNEKTARDGDTSAQGAYGWYDPTPANNAISNAYKLSNKINNDKKAQDETNLGVIESMIGTWKIPGADTVEITSDDINTIAAEEDKSGRSQYAQLSSDYRLDYSTWKGKVDPLDVFVYALIKLHHDKEMIVPLPVVESGFSGVLLKQVHYNNNAIETTKRFWMDYSQTDFDSSYFVDPDGIRNDFAWYLNFRDNVFLERVIPMTQATLDYENFNNNIMQDWGDHLRMKSDWESLSQTNRNAYLTQWAAEWSVSKAETELGKSY